MNIKKIIILINIYLNLSFAASLNLTLSKQNAYLNEPIIATLTLSYLKAENIVDIKPIEFNANNIVTQNISESNATKKDNLLQKKFKLILYPKKTGELYIPQQKISIATKDKKLQQITWKNLFSNESTISIQNIPTDANISGNLYIKTTINKKTFNANKPIKLTLTIYGKGGLDSIKPFKLNLKNQTIFNEKPVIKQNIENNKILNHFIQTYAIVADNNFTIPVFKFKYFNTETQMLETLSTKPIKISIIGTHKFNHIYKNKLEYTLIGFILGLIISAILYYILKSKSRVKNIKLKNKIKACSSNKILYKTLLPYINRYNVEPLVRKLETNIEGKKYLKSYKKEAIKILDN